MKKLLKYLLIFCFLYYLVILHTWAWYKIDKYTWVKFNESLYLWLSHIKKIVNEKINYWNRFIDSQQFNTKGSASDYVIEE